MVEKPSSTNVCRRWMSAMRRMDGSVWARSRVSSCASSCVNSDGVFSLMPIAITRDFRLSGDTTERVRSFVWRHPRAATTSAVARSTAARRARQTHVSGNSPSRTRNPLRSLSREKEQMFSSAANQPRLRRLHQRQVSRSPSPPQTRRPDPTPAAPRSAAPRRARRPAQRTRDTSSTRAVTASITATTSARLAVAERRFRAI